MTAAPPGGGPADPVRPPRAPAADQTPPPQRPLGAPVDDAPSEDDHAWALAVGLGGPWLLLIPLWLGHIAIDRPQPDAAMGAVWYALMVLLAVGLGWLTWRAGGLHVMLWGAGLSLPVALWVAALAQGYGFALIFTLVYFVGTMGSAWTVLGITTLVVGLTGGKHRASSVALAGGMALWGGMGLAAIYLLATIRRQEEMARQAHESPGAAAVWILVVLLLATAFRRGWRGGRR